jgi:hypothetical protein
VITRAAIERDLVIVAFAISAGIHAALVPDHWTEGAAAGAGFAIATVLLGAVAVALTRGLSTVPLAATILLFGGLLASYGLAVTTGLPVFHPHPEAVGGLAVFTKAVELLGLLAATHLLWQRRFALFLTSPRPKGTLA